MWCSAQNEVSCNKALSSSFLLTKLFHFCCVTVYEALMLSQAALPGTTTPPCAAAELPSWGWLRSALLHPCGSQDPSTLVLLEAADSTFCSSVPKPLLIKLKFATEPGGEADVC